MPRVSRFSRFFLKKAIHKLLDCNKETLSQRLETCRNFCTEIRNFRLLGGEEWAANKKVNWNENNSLGIFQCSWRGFRSPWLRSPSPDEFLRTLSQVKRYCLKFLQRDWSRNLGWTYDAKNQAGTFEISWVWKLKFMFLHGLVFSSPCQVSDAKKNINEFCWKDLK